MTLPEARATLAHLGVWMVHDAAYPSVTSAMAGRPIRGSWWGHPDGKRIYALLEALLDGPDTLCLKLLDGKDTLVHRRLWGSVLGAVTAGAPWQTRGLTAEAGNLLDALATGPKLASGPACRAITTRLLAGESRVHTPSGKHATQLEAWADWATREGVELAGAEALESAVEAACAGASARLPWR